jgi:GNAT superfamily N-acetyltransferase
MLESDLATAARFLYASQIQQATNRFLFLDWPNEMAQMALYDASMRQMFEDPSNEMYKITADSGEMIASLILSRKTPSTDEAMVAPAREQKPIDTSAMSPDVRPVMRSAISAVQATMKGIDHLGKCLDAVLYLCFFWSSSGDFGEPVLSTIFVRPDARIKGLGMQLVKLCKDRATAEGLPLFLTSVPSATGFYRKLGFKDTKHVDIDLRQWGPEHGGFGIYRLQGMLAN